MKVIIKNCNNIKETEIDFIEGKKNLIIAQNGTGKSTITKAISLAVEKKSFEGLASKAVDIHEMPEIFVDNTPESLMIFNQQFSDNIVFAKDQLLGDETAHLLLQENEEIRQLKKQVEQQLSNLQQVIASSLPVHVAKHISDFNDISKKNTKEFVLKKKYEGLASKNPFSDLSVIGIFKKVLSKVESKVDWYSWRDKYSLIEANNEYICPYCAQSVSTSLSESFLQFVENTNIKAAQSREDLGAIYQTLHAATTLNIEFLDPIINGKASIESINNNKKLLSLAKTIKDMQETIGQLNELTAKSMCSGTNAIDFNAINIKKLSHLKEYDVISEAFEKLAKEKTTLIKQSGIINHKLVSSLKGNTNILNEFCKLTGIPYEFKVKKVKNNLRVIMYYKKTENIVSSPNQHLSYGEKNALASMIFALIAKQQNTELLIFDDPFSSFDEHKRHYIYHHLFHNKRILKNKTILYFTHDTSSVFDLMYLGIPAQFDTCLSLKNFNGQVKSYSITKQNIKMFKIGLIEYINQSDNEIVKLVYLRKLIEAFENKDGRAKETNYYYVYHFISSYIKGGPLQIKSNFKFTLMSESEIKKAKKQIKVLCNHHGISDFDLKINNLKFIETIQAYKTLVSIQDKLIYYRYLINKDDNNEQRLKKVNTQIDTYFLNLVNHFEKEQFLMIDPQLYSNVPGYVMGVVDYHYQELVEAYQH